MDHRRSPGSEQGAIALVVALSMFLIMGIVLSSLVIGRLVFKRRELQTAADAMVLAAAHTVQQRGLPFTPVMANPFLKRNSDLTILASAYNPVSYRFAYKPQYRRLVRLDLTARYDTWQKWLPSKLLTFKLSSWAQFNEQWFGNRWMMMYFILDASKSMEGLISGGVPQSAWVMLRDTISAYAKLTLPARNGVVIFSKTVEANAPPKVSNDLNIGPILGALKKVDPLNLIGGTNTGMGLAKVRQHYGAVTYPGKTAILLSDGMATEGPGCSSGNSICAKAKAISEGNTLRTSGQGANIVTVELRNTNTVKDPQWAKFLVQIAGAAKSKGNDKDLKIQVSSKLTMEQFINLMVRTICAWGLQEKPNSYYRIRAPMADPSKNPRRLFAFLWDPSFGETALPLVSNIDTYQKSNAFEYCTPAKGCTPAKVILSRQACAYMGANPKRRLIVRWDQPQLAKPLGP